MLKLFKPIFIIIVVVIGCNNIQNKKADIDKKNIVLNDTVSHNIIDSTKTDTICFKNYFMKVISTIAIRKSSKNEKNYFPIYCTKQRLLFYDNQNKSTTETTLPVKKNSKNLDCGKKLEILENEIIYIGIINGKNDFFYSLIGDGGCNECSELYALYSKNGNLLYLDYFEKDIIYNQSGNLDSICTSFGISKKIFSERTYRKKKIFSTF